MRMHGAFYGGEGGRALARSDLRPNGAGHTKRARKFLVKASEQRRISYSPLWFFLTFLPCCFSGRRSPDFFGHSLDRQLFEGL
jgi:hypothetical protein